MVRSGSAVEARYGSANHVGAKYGSRGKVRPASAWTGEAVEASLGELSLGWAGRRRGSQGQSRLGRVGQDEDRQSRMGEVGRVMSW